MQIAYKGHPNTYECETTTVQMQYKYLANTIQIPYGTHESNTNAHKHCKHNTHTSQIPYNPNTNTLQILQNREITIQIQTNTLQMPYKDVADTIRMQWRTTATATQIPYKYIAHLTKSVFKI